jgi:DNA-binding NtrC family response regulator
MLEILGYRTRVVNCADTAFHCLKTESFDAVVSDIVMAGTMDGLGLAKAIRAEWPDLPVLLVTGYSNLVAAREQDFLVLRKPYELTELGRALSRIISKSALSQSPNVIQLPRRPSA